MSFLDLYQGDQEQAARIQPNEGHDLPSGFGENFNAAWSDGRLFSQSTARLNARGAALDDYADEVKSKTGFDLKNDLAPKEGGAPIDYDAVNFKIAALNQQNPNLNIAPLSDDEIDKRALAKAQAAHRNYEALQAGERTAGGAFGSFVGNAASSAADPINIAGLAIAPETAGIGILSAALRWGAVAGVSQAAIEFASDDFKNQVQPGYTESGEPLREIGGAFVGGAALGGITKALGSAWTKVKTGNWPTSVRDAGNVIESEAHTASTNPLPGAEGEVAHREALTKSIDDILAGRPIDVGQQITPELQQAAVEAERAKIVPEEPSGLPPQQLALPLEPPAAPKAARPSFTPPDPLDLAMSGSLNAETAERASEGVKQYYKDVEKHIFGDRAEEWSKLNRQVDRAYDNMNDAKGRELRAKVDQLEQEIGLTPEQEDMLGGSGLPDTYDPEFWKNLRENLQEIEFGRDEALSSVAHQVRYLPKTRDWDAMNNSQRESVLVILSALNAEKTAGRDPMQFLKEAFAQRKARYGGGADAEEIVEAQMKELRDIMGGAIERNGPPPAFQALPAPEQIAQLTPTNLDALQPAMHSPEQMAETLTAPDHQDVIRGDIDRAIDAQAASGHADIMVPGIDELGNHKMVSVHAAVDEVDAYKKLATDIQACATMTEAAE